MNPLLNPRKTEHTPGSGSQPGEDTPVQHKSSKTVTNADVHRLLNIALVGVVEGLTSEHDEAPDVLESAGSTCEVIGTGGARLFWWADIDIIK